MYRTLTLILALLLLPSGTFWAGEPSAKRDRKDRDKKPARRLTLEAIFDANEYAAADVNAEWLDDDSWLRWDAAPGKGLIRVDALTGDEAVLVSRDALIPPGETEPLAVEEHAWSEQRDKILLFTNSARVWRARTRGDYWVFDRSSKSLRKLGGAAPPSSLMFASFSPDGNSVAYVLQNRLHLEDLRTGGIRPITPEDPYRITGTFDWVYEEELSLRKGYRWSPDGQRIAFWDLDTSNVPQFVMVNNTDSFYPQLVTFPYPKTGERNSACRIAVYDLATDTVAHLAIPGDPREHYIARMEWDGPQALVLQQLNRIQNTNTLYRVGVDQADHEPKVLLVETDSAWVDIHDEMFWTEDRSRFTWISERSGWRELYWYTVASGELTRVTPGGFDVIQLLGMDEQDQRLYFLASPENATQRYLYSISFTGTELRRLSPADRAGTHGYTLSPGAKRAIHHDSRFGRAPLIDLVDLPSHGQLRVLEGNRDLRRKLKRLDRGPETFLRIPIEDGVELDAWMIQPPNQEPNRRYPLLVYVYGEPAGQTVLDSWQGNTYLWHRFLAQQGYVVVSIDNRGTPAPRGREFRKLVHRQVGVLAPADQAAAVRWLLKNRSDLDPQRVGVWGWSGGGSMSLNAIFKYPELYRTAISVAPVPNQRHYDTIYQERYMGLPADNVAGYLQGSPLHFAAQLQGNLLLIHGTGDDNCHYQGTEALINELVQAGKTFQMLAYPNRTHAIREGAGTTLHLRRTMFAFLQDKLPAGPAVGSAE